MKIKKIIRILEFIVFFITLTTSLFLFAIYAVIKLDQEYFIKSAHLTELQSDDLKNLTGLSNFSALTIKGYNHKLVTGNGSRCFSFDITIPVNEFENFSEFINNQANQSDYQRDSCIYIKEDSLTLRKSLYRLQIEYNTLNGYDILEYFLSTDYIEYSKNTWIVILQFILLLFVNSLIIIPDRIINLFLHNNKKYPPK